MKNTISKFVCLSICLFFLSSAIANPLFDKFKLISVPILKGDIAPYSGILFDEKSVIQIIKDKNDLLYLQTITSLKEESWSEKEKIYKQSFVDLQKDRDKWIDKSKRGWWEQNGTAIMFIFGIITGGAFSYLMYKVSR